MNTPKLLSNVQHEGREREPYEAPIWEGNGAIYRVPKGKRCGVNDSLASSSQVYKKGASDPAGKGGSGYDS